MKNIKYSHIQDAMECLVEDWGAQGERVIEAIVQTEHKPMSYREFLDNCYACGGNWGGMLLSGIKALFPEVWDAIPEDMGRNTFADLCQVLLLLGIVES